MSDSTADRRRFDPRFDPAFQPGFDAGEQAAADRAPGRRSADATSRPAAVPQPPERWASPPEPAARQVAEYDDDSRPDPAGLSGLPATAPDVDDLVAEREADAASDRGTNPFAVVLWVVSIVLVASGIVLFRSIPGLEAQNSTGGGVGGQSSLSQLLALGTLSAMLIGSGILIAAANLFLLAVRWSGRRR